MSRSQMQLRWLVGLGIVVVGGLIALYFIVIRDDEPASVATTEMGTGAGTTAGSGTVARDTTRSGPSLPSTPGTPALPTPEAGSAMTSAGNTGKAPPMASPIDKANPVVTDHRTDKSGGKVIPGTGSAVAPGRQLPTEHVTTLAEAARPGMVACGAAIPKDARGDRPKVAATVTVTIAGETMRVSDSTPVVTGIVDAAAHAEAESCIRKALAGIEVAAPGEADLAGYQINLSYAVR